MVWLQAAHSVEEYVFKLYERFPPMRFIYRSVPELARPAFIVFNLFLFLFGLFCYFYWVRPERKGAAIIIWIWIAIQIVTISAHLVWAILTGGYNPGLATVPLFIPVVIYLIYQLRRD